MLGITVSTTLSGRTIARTGRYSRFPLLGLGLMSAALVVLAAFAGHPSRIATGIGDHRRETEMQAQNTQITRRLLEELFEKGNLDAVDELVHPTSSTTRRRPAPRAGRTGSARR
jgi:hypothetical protein